MQCPRCQGLMITTRMKDTSCPDVIVGWRCLLCGESTDPAIEANRASPTLSVRSRARVPGSPVAKIGKARVWLESAYGRPAVGKSWQTPQRGPK